VLLLVLNVLTLSSVVVVVVVVLLQVLLSVVEQTKIFLSQSRS